MMTKHVVRRKGTIEADVDGEIVALAMDQSMYYGLNSVGSRIWKMIEIPWRVEDLCARLVTEYEVDRPTCEREVLALLEELAREDLIEVKDAPEGR